MSFRNLRTYQTTPVTAQNIKSECAPQSQQMWAVRSAQLWRHDVSTASSAYHTSRRPFKSTVVTICTTCLNMQHQSTCCAPWHRTALTGRLYCQSITRCHFTVNTVSLPMPTKSVVLLSPIFVQIRIAWWICVSAWCTELVPSRKNVENVGRIWLTSPT